MYKLKVMKTFTKSFNILIVLFFTINLFNCSSNDDILEQDPNKISFNGKTYQVSGGFFEDSGNYNEFSMALFPSGIDINTNDYTINGGNWYLEIELLTDGNTIEGTYTCGVDVFGYFIDNAQFIDDELQPGKEVFQLNKSGTLTINKVGSEYEFIYNAFDDRDIPFTSYYKGSFIERK
tara:strand:- start:50680 stop:51213 length:534 start_codon:yes stop_codon:yes gene_type:complete